MTKLFTKLASAITLLALVASFVPATAFAQEASVDSAVETISDLVTIPSEDQSEGQMDSEDKDSVVEKSATEETVVEDQEGFVEQVIEAAANLFSIDESVFENLVAPETAPVTINRNVAIDGSWTTDRHEPGSWNNGEVEVNGILDAQQQSTGFYRTEGRKTSLNNVSSIETTLFIDPSWDDTAVRAGVWATGNGAVAEWGIIEYTTAHGYTEGSLTEVPTFRTWNSTTGEWTPVMEAVAGQSYTLRVEITDGNWYYFINDSLVGEVAVDGTDTTGINEVILNHYNFGFEGVPADGEFGNRPYTVQWSNMNVGYSYNTLSSAVSAAEVGDTVVVNKDIAETSAVIVDKALTIDGQEHTLTLKGQSFAGAVSGIGLTGGATVEKLTVKGELADGTKPDGITTFSDNLIEVTGPATLRDVTVTDSKQAGITVLDGGQLTLGGNIALTGNKWGGINVKHDVGAKVTFASDADLTFSVSSDAAANAAPVWVDADVLATAGNYVVDNGNVVEEPVLVGGKVFWYATPEPATSNGGGGSRGRSGGSSRAVDTTTTGTVDGGTAGAGQVLGAETYNFTTDLTIGSTGADVVALQQMLIDAGLLMIPAPTGYFGAMTKAALAKWQAAHGVPATGYFGPLTRAAVAAAGTPAPAMSAEARAALIKELLEKVKELQEKLDKAQKDAA